MKKKAPFYIKEYLNGKLVYASEDDKVYGPILFKTIDEANAAAKALYDKRKSEEETMKDRVIKTYNREGVWQSMFIDEE